MESRIAGALGCGFGAVGIGYSDERPGGAVGFVEGRRGCVMHLFASAAKGRVAVADARTCGCRGGEVGLGFGAAYEEFPGGLGCFKYFLSVGNSQWEKGRAVGAALQAGGAGAFAEMFLGGEAYKKTPELVERFVEGLPVREAVRRYVVFRPLADVEAGGPQPEVVVFVVNADQLGALVFLANYGRESYESVTIPAVAGCQAIGILPLREGESQRPRGVVGMTDPSARLELRRMLGAEYFTFAVPWKMFEEMEGNVEGSFLERGVWGAIKEKS